MTPKVAKRGRSFKGAAAYYLHDKGADSSHRVAFCVTRNLPTDVPEKAWRLMAYTDRHAGILKHKAGGARSGPKKRKPVYTLSLSWHADDKPDPELMVRMMDSALKKIGLERCQSLYVAHNDTGHPHIHALVNLVDPDNGKIIDPGKDHDKLSRWAQSYEAEKGVIRCQRRVENNARRDRGEWVVDRHSKTRQDIEQARLIEREILRQRREQLWGQQVAEREALKAQAKARAEAIRAELKQRYRPAWAALFKKQRQDRRDVANARRSVLAAMRVAIKERRRLTPDGRAGIATILSYAISARALSDALLAAEERELAALGQQMADDRRRMVKVVWDQYGQDVAALRQTQAEARKVTSSVPSEEQERRQAAPTKVQPLEAEDARGAEPTSRTVQPEKRGPVRLNLPEVGGSPTVPQMDEEARRREELKAEFRRQAEEIARRRKERAQKEKDRDRDRER